MRSLSVCTDSERKVDVICQHKSDGSIIPMKVRIQDDDGEFQVYLIKSYKTLTQPGDCILPSGVTTTTHTWQFECKISVFDVEKRIKLFYNAYENYWKVTYIG